MKQAGFKKIRSLWRASNPTAVIVGAILAFFSLFSANASAACGVSASPQFDFALPAELQGHAAGTAPQALELPSESSSNERRPSITGLWFVTLYSGGALFDQGFDQWHSDGTEILVDSPPPSLGNVCLGVWKQTGHNTYKLRHPNFNWDANGNLIGTALILETITVDADGDRYRGTFVFDIYDLSGKLTTQISGNLKAHRIQVE
jgi:hypothetical protein